MAFPRPFPVLQPLRHHRWLRRTVWALLGLLLLWLLGWLLVPLTKGPLERRASEMLGRQVTVGALEFTPWTLEITLRKLTVAGRDGAPPQLEIERIYADGELQSLLRWAPVVDALTVDAPHLRLGLLADGHSDADDILARFAKPADAPETGPARLALYNLTLADGAIDVTDHRVHEQHTVRHLALQVPFVSTLASQRGITVVPHLSFDMGESHFSSSAQATPFGPASRGEAHLKWDGLDLEPYLAYLPANLPVQLQGAVLDLDLKLAFEQTPKVAFKVTGTAQAHKVSVVDRSGQPLLAWDRLSLALDDVRPLEKVVRLGRVELNAPVLSAARDEAGSLNFAQLMASALPASAEAAPAGVEPASPAPTSALPWSVTAAKPPARGAKAPASTAPGWQVSVAQIAVRQGTLRWADQSTRPATALEATALSVDANGLAFPLQKPVAFHAALGLHGSTLALKGEASDQLADVQLSVQNLGLELAAPYLAKALVPELRGQINGNLQVKWTAGATPGATGMALSAGPLTFSELALTQGKNTLASVHTLALEDAQVDLASHAVDVGRLAVGHPQTHVERDAAGHWMFERWLKEPAAALPGQAETLPAQAQAEARPWRVKIAKVSVEDAALRFTDRAQPRPVALRVAALDLQASQWVLDGTQPQAFKLSARVGAAEGETGKLSYQGTLTPRPLAIKGRVDASGLPLQTLDGYVADRLAIELLQGEAGFRGELNLAQTERGMALALHGDAAIDRLRANSTGGATPKTASQVGEELLAWKSMGLRGLQVALAPGTAPRVEVQETSLTDFYARLSIDETGRINLDQLVKTPGPVPPANATPPQAAQSTPAAVPTPTRTAATQAAAPDPLAPVLQFGPVSLVNGKVLFSDYFIKPNYSADLSELTGTLSAFSSQPAGSEPVLADLVLRGRAEGSASLEVTGRLNPLAKPLALDIKGKVRDLELPPLSPYAVKYAGHGIERGKLSMDVAYKVLPNGQLTASNNLVLHQLTFGEAVAGAPSSLPVKLAVALLADSHGVIDLDVPISGSLNDPQFRIGPVIFKIIVNLIGKAITAPFSLLASALGGGEDLSSVPFAPGSAVLSAEARQALTQVAKALTERPGLNVTVTGTASLPQEREAMQRERLHAMVRAELLSEAANQPVSKATDSTHTGAEMNVPSAVDTLKVGAADNPAAVPAAQYPALLQKLYDRTDMPKPRNLVGIAETLPVADMEALLLAHLPAATSAQARALASERAQVVKRFLAAQNLSATRLFLAAPQLMSESAGSGGAWTPQAELSLAAK